MIYKSVELNIIENIPSRVLERIISSVSIPDGYSAKVAQRG